MSMSAQSSRPKREKSTITVKKSATHLAGQGGTDAGQDGRQAGRRMKVGERASKHTRL